MNKPIITQVIKSPNDSKWMVVWGFQDHLDNYMNIDHWEIYRKEGSSWVKAGESDMSRNNGYYTFIDSSDSSPFAHAQQYKIRGIYSINSNPEPETDFSDVHQTQHLSINSGLNNTYNINISSYEIDGDIPSSATIKIYKGDSSNGRLQYVASLPMDSDGLTTYMDNANQYTYYVADVILDNELSLYTNLSLNPTTLYFEWDGSIETFEITSNTNWVISDNVSWLSYGNTHGSGNDVIGVTTEEYDDPNGDPYITGSIYVISGSYSDHYINETEIISVTKVNKSSGMVGM